MVFFKNWIFVFWWPSLFLTHSEKQAHRTPYTRPNRISAKLPSSILNTIRHNSVSWQNLQNSQRQRRKLRHTLKEHPRSTSITRTWYAGMCPRGRNMQKRKSSWLFGQSLFFLQIRRAPMRHRVIFLFHEPGKWRGFLFCVSFADVADRATRSCERQPETRLRQVSVWFAGAHGLVSPVTVCKYYYNQQ